VLQRAIGHLFSSFPRKHGPGVVEELLVSQLAYLCGLTEVGGHVVDLFAAFKEHPLDLAHCLSHYGFWVYSSVKAVGGV